MVIKDSITLIVIKGWYFDLSRLEEVKNQAQKRFEDFCEINGLNPKNFFWEITK